MAMEKRGVETQAVSNCAQCGRIIRNDACSVHGTQTGELAGYQKRASDEDTLAPGLPPVRTGR